jgi:hypothetical protein
MLWPNMQTYLTDILLIGFDARFPNQNQYDLIEQLRLVSVLIC